MKFTDFQGDNLKETNGVWLEFDDAKFLIAANQNPNHRKVQTRLSKKNQRALRTGDDAAQDGIVIEAMAEAIVLGWENINDGAGQPFSYSKENAIKLLTSTPLIREFCAMESMRLSNFQDKKEEAAKAETKSSPEVVPSVG